MDRNLPPIVRSGGGLSITVHGETPESRERIEQLRARYLPLSEEQRLREARGDD